MSDLNLKTEIIGNNQIAHLIAEGFIDTNTVVEVETSLRKILEKQLVKIVVNLNKVNYVSSAGWGVFVSEIKDIRDKKGDIILIGMSSEVYDVYELMEFSTILKSFNNINEGLEYFGVTETSSAQVVDPLKGQIKNESPVEGAVAGLDSKVKEIMSRQPDISSGDLRKVLALPENGGYKIGFFEVRSLIKKFKNG